MSHAGSDDSVTAAQVGGTWKRSNAEFRICTLGKQRLQIEVHGAPEPWLQRLL
jgi:hypothetical protein